MNPNLSDIYYFREVAESANLSRAAERLGVTQPSLSVAMKRLEAAVGCDLLVRSKTGVVLTKNGETFLKQSRSLVKEWESLRDGIRAGEFEPRGEYTIGCHPSVGMYTLPVFLPSLLNKYPDLSVKLEHDHSRKIAERVIRFDLDFGIVVNPVKHPDLVIKELCVDLVRFWVKPSIKAQVVKSGVLICDPALNQSQKLMASLKKTNFEVKKVITSKSLELVSRLTEAGLGVGIIPTRVADMQSNKKLKAMPGFPEFKDKICLVYRHEIRQHKASQKIIEAISGGVY